MFREYQFKNLMNNQFDFDEIWIYFVCKFPIFHICFCFPGYFVKYLEYFTIDLPKYQLDLILYQQPSSILKIKFVQLKIVISDTNKKKKIHHCEANSFHCSPQNL